MSSVIKNSRVMESKRLRLRPEKLEQPVGVEFDEAPSEPAAPDLREIFADELSALREQEKQRGYQDGLDAATTSLEQDFSAREKQLQEELQIERQLLGEEREKFAQLIEAVKSERQTELMQLESHVVELALTCLYKLVGDSDKYQDMVNSLVRESLKVFEGQDGIRIRLSPSDAKLFVQDGEAMAVSVVPDVALEPGRCIVDSGDTLLDTGVISQLDALRDTLIKTYKSRADSHA